MDKNRLISTILNEIKDPALRDKLLAQVAEAESTPGTDSFVLNELDRLGIDSEAAKDLLGCQLPRPKGRSLKG